jgi:hypothetical protein
MVFFELPSLFILAGEGDEIEIQERYLRERDREKYDTTEGYMMRKK